MAIVPLRYLASMNESRTTTRGPVEYWQRGQTLLLVGVGLTLAGIAYDAYWHSHHGALDVGIPAPHYVTLLGMVVALVGIVAARARATGRRRTAFSIGLVAAVAQLVGATWDTLLHYAGQEPAPWAAPHALYRIGFLTLLVVVLVVVARDLLRR